MRLTRWAVTFAVVGLALVPHARASSFAAVSDAQLVREASDVVRGRVLSVKSAWDADGTAIWTTALVRVENIVKGRLVRGRIITVKEVGGTLDGYTVHAEGFPTFNK